MAETIETISLFENETWQSRFPSIRSLKEQDYFLQFNAYQVWLPSTSKQFPLNIFEITVLRLIAAGIVSINELSEKICLKKDLITFICTHLEELKFIDGTKKITDLGLQAIGKKLSAISPDVKPQYLLATCDTAEILPIFFPCDSVFKGNYEKPKLKINFGTTGKTKFVEGRCIFVGKDKRSTKIKNVLSQEEIRAAIKNFNRTTTSKIFLDETANITSTSTGKILLHVKAVLQDGNVDYLIVSEGTKQHNDFLRAYLDRQSPNILQWLKESSARITADKQEQAGKNFEGKKYPEIRKLMKKLNVNAKTSDERQVAQNNANRQVENLAKTIEWSLQYHLRKYPPPQDVFQVMAIQNLDENLQLLQNVAESLGLHSVKNFPTLFSDISGAAVANCLKTENPQLKTLLGINILTAARIPDSKILDALESIPDVFNFLYRLSNYGNEIKHSGNWTPAGNDTVENLYEKVSIFVKTLLPDYENPDAEEFDLSNESIKKINAQLAIMKILDEKIFQNLPGDVQNLLLKISPDKNRDQLPAPVDFIETLSIILEKILNEKIAEKITVKKSEIIARLKKFGDKSNLRTVNDSYYNAACQKGKATLGAYALAYMATLDDENLKYFVEKNFPTLVAEIVTLRGHGNNILLVVEEEKLIELRAKLFNTIEILEVDR